MRRWLGGMLVLAACGARTPLGTRDGGVLPVGDATPDAPQISVDCTWEIVGPPVRVSGDPAEVPGDVGLEDAVATTGGALVAWVTPGDLSHPQTAVARLVAFDLVLNGFEHVVLRAPDVTTPLWDVSLGQGFGHVAITAWTGARCLLRPVTLDGASNGSMVDVGTRSCGGLEATSPGFDLLLGANRATDRLESMAIDPIGTPLAAPTNIFVAGPGDAIGAAGRATLSDGSFIAAAVIVSPPGGRVVARHLDASGAALGDFHVVSASNQLVSTDLSIAAVTGGALVASVRFDGSAGHAEVAALHTDAQPAATPLVVSSSTVSVTAIDLTSDVTGGALLAWNEYDPAASSVHVLALSPAGTPRGAPLVVPDPVAGARYAPAVRVVTTGKQGLVVFGGRSATTNHRVYAAPLACAP